MRIWQEKDDYLAVLGNLHLFTLWHLSDVEVSLRNLQKEYKNKKIINQPEHSYSFKNGWIFCLNESAY